MIIFIKDYLNPNSLSLNFDINAEILFCSISPERMDPIIIFCVYRPEKGGEHCLRNICNAINCLNFSNIVILRDFNFQI